MPGRRGIAVGVCAVMIVLGSANQAAAETVVASWGFDQSGGVIEDLQPGDRDLKLSGHWSEVAGGSGDGIAIRFLATPATAATAVSNGAAFNPGTGPFALTVELRGTEDVTSGSPNVAQHGMFSDSGQIKMQLKAGGKVGCRVKGSSRAYLFYHSSASVNDNLWHTVTCARDPASSELSVTVDGNKFSPVGSENPGSVQVNNQPMRFAQKRSTGERSDQFIGDIAFASYSQ